MDYGLIRSKRKTVSLRITKEGRLEVRAPLKLSKATIEQLIESKQKWITDHLAVTIIQNQQKAGFSLSYESMLVYRGQEYPIQAVNHKQAYFDGEFFSLPYNLDKVTLKNTIISIYKKLAKEYIATRVLYYAHQMGVMPTGIKINSAKTRWGSCSGKNSLNFSWLLILAPDTVIDYVIVHELAHIKEHNHSAKFWGFVEYTLADYKVGQEGLKVLQSKLILEDWSEPCKF
ncbi:MAG: SprT family zinc-dependent metalloprotease [Oscillospiraceae bacterium]